MTGLKAALYRYRLALGAGSFTLIASACTKTAVNCVPGSVHCWN